VGGQQQFTAAHRQSVAAVKLAQEGLKKGQTSDPATGELKFHGFPQDEEIQDFITYEESLLWMRRQLEAQRGQLERRLVKVVDQRTLALESAEQTPWAPVRPGSGNAIDYVVAHQRVPSSTNYGVSSPNHYSRLSPGAGDSRGGSPLQEYQAASTVGGGASSSRPFSGHGRTSRPVSAHHSSNGGHSRPSSGGRGRNHSAAASGSASKPRVPSNHPLASLRAPPSRPSGPSGWNTSHVVQSTPGNSQSKNVGMGSAFKTPEMTVGEGHDRSWQTDARAYGQERELVYLGGKARTVGKQRR
jgi:hypothetical protein